MFYLGMLSLIQICLLPGLILLKLFKIPKGFIQQLIYSFGLSLIFNHLVVVILTYLKVNLRAVHLALFTLEIGLAIYLYWPAWREPLSRSIKHWSTRVQGAVEGLIRVEDRESGGIQGSLNSLVGLFFLAWSFVSVAWAIDQLVDNLGSVFTLWDAVVSWNRWAVEWFSNAPPVGTWRYPQLIPTNFSLTYTFMGSPTLQVFAIGFMPLFGIYLLLLLLDLGLAYRNYAYFIGLVATQYLLKRFYLPYLSSGYVDVAVVFFTFLSVHALLKAASDPDEDRKGHYALVGFIFAAGTALTKQNGLFVVAVYPLLAYWIVFSQMESLTRKEKLIRTATYFGLAVLLLLPWYGFNELRILQGAKSNVLQLISQEHHSGRTLIERLARAYKDLSIYFYLYPIVILTLPFVEKNIRRIVLLILLPYSLIWGFLFSLYTRNLSIGFALLGLAAGHAAAALINLAVRVSEKIKFTRLPLIAFILLLVLSGIGLGLLFPTESLVRSQISKQKLALDPDVNQELYSFFEGKGQLEPIFTNYPLRYLPGFEELQVDIGGFEDPEFFKERLQEFPDVRYMLISLYKDNDQTLQIINHEIELGHYRVIFHLKRYMFVEILP